MSELLNMLQRLATAVLEGNPSAEDIAVEAMALIERLS